MEIEGTSRACKTCMLNQNNPSKAPIHCREYLSKPWEKILIDYAGLFFGYMFLIVVDANSKCTEICVMEKFTVIATIEKIREIFTTHGPPELMVSDNGPCFSSQDFKMFMKVNGI